MSTSQTGFLANSEFTDVDLDASVEVLASAALTLYGVEIDNTQNAVDVYVKIFDNASPTLGTTEPDFVFKCDASQKTMIPLGSGGQGVALAAALAVACVTTPGLTGSTSPTNDVKGTFLTD